MNKEFVRKCCDVFEDKQEIQDVKAEASQFQEYFNCEISTEYLYILERYAGIYIQEEYGFNALEKTPLTDKDGFDSMCFFFPLKGKKNIFDTYEIYKQQLPTSLIPIGELDGGNLLCLNRATGSIYIWIHDELGDNSHLVRNSMYEFILSFKKMIPHEDTDLGIVEAKFSPDFLKALRDYKG